VLDLGPLGWLLPDGLARRAFHGACMALGTAFALCGYFVAYTYHEDKGMPHLPFALPEVQSPLARSAHVVIGLVAVGGCVLQSLVGLAKVLAEARGGGGPRALRLHGLVGPAVWLCGVTCVALAAYFEYMSIATSPAAPRGPRRRPAD